MPPTAVILLLTLGLGAASDTSSPTLRERIDSLVEGSTGGAVAAPATDAEFVRRIWLDLAGVIPPVEEARSYIDDPSPYKRERLVDRLLSAPSYARRMQLVFDEMWMERRGGTAVPPGDWQAWLFRAFAENRPYDLMVRQVLEADGSGTREERAPARFLLDRGAEPNLIVRDVGRMFLGRDLQCAQCHDHPLIEDYYQRDYYGLFAFVSRTSLVTDPATKLAALAEKADGEVTFVSVFKKSVTSATGPRVMDGSELMESPSDTAHPYLVAPADNVRSRPAMSRRQRLGAALTSAEAPAFDRNIANRLWALVMKRGLVTPVDFDHSANPPSHPELLELLGREFRAMGCDIKAFIRELVLTQAYARSSEAPPGASEDLVDPSRFAVAGLKPMSAEQMGWSVLQATGVLASYTQSERTRMEVVDPRLRDIFDADSARRTRLEWEIERGVYEKLNSSVSAFIPYFSAGEARPPDSIDANVHQALFLANGGSVHSWIPTLVGRAMARADADGMADELYLSILSRRPSGEERGEFAAHLAARGLEKKGEAMRELAFALLASAEFRFQH